MTSDSYFKANVKHFEIEFCCIITIKSKLGKTLMKFISQRFTNYYRSQVEFLLWLFKIPKLQSQRVSTMTRKSCGKVRYVGLFNHEKRNSKRKVPHTEAGESVNEGEPLSG